MNSLNTEKTKENNYSFEGSLDATTKQLINQIKSKSAKSTKLIVKPILATRQQSVLRYWSQMKTHLWRMILT
jgi:hypothetical protein